MNVSTEKLKSLKIFWQKEVSSSGKLAEKTCPDQELVSKSVENSSKFGEIWQEIVTKIFLSGLLRPKIWNSAPHSPPPPQNKS